MYGHDVCLCFHVGFSRRVSLDCIVVQMVFVFLASEGIHVHLVLWLCITLCRNMSHGAMFPPQPFCHSSCDRIASGVECRKSRWKVGINMTLSLTWHHNQCCMDERDCVLSLWLLSWCRTQYYTDERDRVLSLQLLSWCHNQYCMDGSSAACEEHAGQQQAGGDHGGEEEVHLSVWQCPWAGELLPASPPDEDAALTGAWCWQSFCLHWDVEYGWGGDWACGEWVGWGGGGMNESDSDVGFTRSLKFATVPQNVLLRVAYP